MQKLQQRKELIQLKVNNLVNSLKRLREKYVNIGKPNMTITIEQLQKQVDVLTDSHKMLLKVISEKNEQIRIYEFMLRAEEEEVFTFTPDRKTN